MVVNIVTVELPCNISQLKVFFHFMLDFFDSSILFFYFEGFPSLIFPPEKDTWFAHQSGMHIIMFLVLIKAWSQYCGTAQTFKFQSLDLLSSARGTREMLGQLVTCGCRVEIILCCQLLAKQKCCPSKNTGTTLWQYLKW